MTGAELIRLVRRLARRRGVEVRFVAQRGKGSHGTLYFGGRKTVVKDRKKELGSGAAGPDVGQSGDWLGGVEERAMTLADRLVLAWPAVLRPQVDGRVLVRFPDLPEAVTEGDDEGDALAQAADCLAEAIADRIADREAIPAPSRVAQGVPVALEAVLAYKVALYAAMRAGGLTGVGLALRLGIDEKDVRRLLDPRHRGSRLARLVEALAACGVETGVVVLGEGAGRRLFDPVTTPPVSAAVSLEPVT